MLEYHELKKGELFNINDASLRPTVKIVNIRKFEKCTDPSKWVEPPPIVIQWPEFPLKYDPNEYCFSEEKLKKDVEGLEPRIVEYGRGRLAIDYINFDKQWTIRVVYADGFRLKEAILTEYDTIYEKGSKDGVLREKRLIGVTQEAKKDLEGLKKKYGCVVWNNMILEAENTLYEQYRNGSLTLFLTIIHERPNY